MKDRMVCECYGITVDDIRKALQNGASGFKDIEATMRIGVMCNACTDDAKKVIATLKAEMD